MTVIKHLEMDFDPDAKLEIDIHNNNNWAEVTADIFRSFGGNRRINGKQFNGNLYNLGTNNIIKEGGIK